MPLLKILSEFSLVNSRVRGIFSPMAKVLMLSASSFSVKATTSRGSPAHNQPGQSGRHQPHRHQACSQSVRHQPQAPGTRARHQAPEPGTSHQSQAPATPTQQAGPARAAAPRDSPLKFLMATMPALVRPAALATSALVVSANTGSSTLAAVDLNSSYSLPCSVPGQVGPQWGAKLTCAWCPCVRSPRL